MGIKISDISNILLQDPQNKKWDKKYIDGVIKEQLAVLDYKSTFPQGLNEQDEDKDDEDVELDPESIPLPKEEPENIEISDDELIPKGDEEDIIDVESEPEITPETIPVPDEPISPEIEKKQAEYTTISKEQARELLSYKGKIATAVFTKRGDGSIRAMNLMTGVRKYTSGGELPYSPKDKGLIPVYDLKIGNAAKGYRMLNLDGLKTLNMDGKKYKIDPFLKENIKRTELKQIIKEVLSENSLIESIDLYKPNELEGKGIKYKIFEDNKRKFHVELWYKDKHYGIKALPIFTSNPNINFGDIDENGTWNLSRIIKSPYTNIIMASIFGLIRYWVDKHNIKEFEYGAEGDMRVGLYKLYMQKHFPDYKNYQEEYNDHVIQLWRKKD